MIRSFLGIVGAALFTTLAACSTSTDPSAESSGSDIINGVDASPVEFNAIGGLVWVGKDGTESLCTATLIAKNVVLTAKHCAMANPSQQGSPDHLSDGKIYFLTGPDLQHPLQVSQATSVTLASIYQGGFTGLGSDVSIFTLTTPITGIDPIAVAATPPTAADVGSQFIGIGYGIQDAKGTTGTRKMGNITLRSVTGAPAPMVWSDANAYLTSIEAQMGTSPSTLTDAQKAQITSEYSTPLSDGYEVFVGGAAGDSQICHGDSGGPLLRKEANGKYMVHGVTSTTMDQVGTPPVCKSGGIYTVFGANTRDVIAKQIGEHCGLDASAHYACGMTAAPATCSAPALQPTASAAPSTLETCLAGSCCAEANDCFGDAGCTKLSTCFDACDSKGGDTTTCAQTCYAADPQSYVKYLGFATCAQTSCATASTATGSTTSTAATTTTSAHVSGLEVRIH